MSGPGRHPARAAFALLHHGPGPLLLPNAWDLASALALQAAGHPALGTTSLGITAAAGLPDGAGAGRELTLALVQALVPRLHVPLTVDLEGGYSEDPRAVADLVAELAALGVAGVNLEDGRPDGSLRTVEDHAAVVAAAPYAFINARTDTCWQRPVDLAETLRRVGAYRDAGAHGVFVPGLTDLAATAGVAAAAEVPLNVLWRRGVGLRDLATAGVARVSTGSAPYRAALSAAVAEADLARGGDGGAGVLDYSAVQALLAGPDGF